MKKTPLYNCHVELGAKLVDFAGFEMPVRYAGLKEEHMAVRDSVGIFDVSHMGEFKISGPQAIDLIAKVSSNNPSTLKIGDAQYTCMPNQEGGIIDDMITYRLGEEEYMLVVNASNIQKDWNWITSHNTYDAAMQNISEQISLIAVQGPHASRALQQLTEVDLANIDYYSFSIGSLAGVDNIIISATGYTGSGGFELYVPSESAAEVWNAILNGKGEYKVSPAGLGARDTLRLEMGYCLYGNDIDDTTSPYEAGLAWITKLDHDFINRDGLLAQKESGIKRRLAGFKMENKGIPREGYDILSADGEVIGKVTSGTQSPMLECGIGLGYIDIPYHKKGTDILIQIRKKQLPAIVSRPPFVSIPKL